MTTSPQSNAPMAAKQTINLRAEVEENTSPVISEDPEYPGRRIVIDNNHCWKHTGKVVIERHGDRLFIDSRELVFSAKPGYSDTLYYGAHVLDFLLEHTEFIPDSLKERSIRFRGTEFNVEFDDKEGGGVTHRCRMLKHTNGAWRWEYSTNGHTGASGW